jgi:hypothetical protein
MTVLAHASRGRCAAAELHTVRLLSKLPLHHNTSQPPGGAQVDGRIEKATRLLRIPHK